jgi:acyl-CoA thioesterase I
MKFLSTLVLSISALLLSACGGGGSSGPAVVVAYGDSLTENKGQFVTPSEHWTERLKAQISAEGITSVTVINEGIGGEDSQRALDRLPGVLANYKPTHIILTHGTNDLPPNCLECPEVITRPYIESMAKLAKDAGATVIMGEFTVKYLGGGLAQAYTVAYQTAARNTDSTYVNLVAGLPYDLSNYFPDGIHFTDAAQETIKNNIASVLLPMLR